jgi:hypothetical protein
LKARTFLVQKVDIISERRPSCTLQSSSNKQAFGDALRVKGRLHAILFNNELSCVGGDRETGEVKSYYPDFDPSNYMEYAFGGVHVLSPEFSIGWRMDGKVSHHPFLLVYLCQGKYTSLSVQ